MNPLQKYFRQPKIYVALPSKGVYYKNGQLQGEPTNLPIFGMSGMDEIVFKTPDALFSGEATIKVLESCCPAIKDAWSMPTLDVDYLLVAIRIATFGNNMTFNHSCTNCQAQNDFEIDLTTILEYFGNIEYKNQIEVDGLIITVRPLTYRQMSNINIETFKLQKQLYQVSNEWTEEEKQSFLDNIYKLISNQQIESFLMMIEAVQTSEATVDNAGYIKEWFKNSERAIYDAIRKHLEEVGKVWRIPKSHIKCDECGHEQDVEISMDQSSFFGNA